MDRNVQYMQSDVVQFATFPYISQVGEEFRYLLQGGGARDTLVQIPILQVKFSLIFAIHGSCKFTGLVTGRNFWSPKSSNF